MVLRSILKLIRIFMRHKILGVAFIALMILFGYLFFFLIGPLILTGPPLPLYYIDNRSSENHTIIVEIFDENNISVLRETYNLLPEEEIQYERGIGWGPKITWYLFTWADGIYTFYLNLDDKYSEWYTMDVFPTSSLDINLFYKDKRTNETFPIYIRELCI